MLGAIQNLLKENACEAQAQKMSAYMKGHFAFAGIPRPKLLKLAAPIFKASAKNPLDWNFVFDLWQEDFREAQYIALEYIGRHHKELVSSDIDNLKSLIVEKSWWETADTIDGFVGELVLKDESLKTTMLEWASDRNLWLRRVAIDFQQRYKDLTDVPLLEKIICLNFGSGEFFIDKAIGWSLRDYSKVNPDWVHSFLERYSEKLAPLSIREAGKYL